MLRTQTLYTFVCYYYMVSSVENKYIKNKTLPKFSSKVYNVTFLYLDPKSLESDSPFGWEHDKTYDFNYEEMPPIHVRKVGNKYYFNDGHHRVNFCIKNNLKVPCVIVEPKPNTHTHEYRKCGMTIVERVLDCECEKKMRERIEEDRVYLVVCDKNNKFYKK